MLSRSIPCSVLFLSLIVLAPSGCKTTGSSDAISSSSSPTYTLFWDQGDHLKELLEAEKFDDAAAMYAQQQDYFLARRDEHGTRLDTLAGKLNAAQTPTVLAALAALDAVQWPTTAESWPGIAAALTSATRAGEEYNRHVILTESRYRSATATTLEQRAAALRKQLNADAAGQFGAFDHFGSMSFFDIYPADVPPGEVLQAGMPGLRDQLSRATPAALKRFIANYPKEMHPAETWSELGRLYIGASLRRSEKTGPKYLARLLTAIQEAREIGFTPKRLDALSIGFVEVTSRALLKQGQIEFPAEVTVDLPADVTKVELDKALSTPLAKNSDYVVIFDVALAKARRKISTKKSLPSRFIAGYRTEPNPDYNVAQNRVNQAQIEMQQTMAQQVSADSQYCYGLGCLAR